MGDLYKPMTPGYIKPLAAPDYSKPDDLGLYSHGAVVASKMPIAKGTPQQIKGYLTKQGVKPDEFKWSGYDEKLGGKKMVTREEVAKHFHENKPAITEEVLGDDPGAREWQTDGPTKYSSYVLPGDRNYREHVLTLPNTAFEKEHAAIENRFARARREAAERLSALKKLAEEHGNEHPVTSEAFRKYAEAAKAESDLSAALEASHRKGASSLYQSTHWEQPNVLAHLRLSDRPYSMEKGERDETGHRRTNLKALHLEELQSDWAQKGREHGFKSAPLNETERLELSRMTDPLAHGLPENHPIDWTRRDELEARANEASHDKKPPHAPYVDSTSKWVDLGLKRALYEAAKGGYHKLVITPGEEQAKRYDLSKHISKIHYDKDTKNLVAYDHSGQPTLDSTATPEELHKHIGKEAAEKLLQAPAGGGFQHELSGVDLKVGGEGMKAFYDRMLPQALQKLAQRHDPAAEVKLHGHDLTASKHPKWAPAALHENSVEHGHGRSVPLHSLDITPKMRASILKGHAHFETGGAVEGYARGGAVNHNPTEAQKAAGNYAKKHISFQGLQIAIENEKGSIRKGKSANGHQWRCVLPADYGYLKGTVGADKDHVDCYVGPDKDSHIVFVVNQHVPGKGFDEHKVMLGFKTEEDALCCYVAAFSDGFGAKRIGSVETMSLDGFKKWLHRGRTTKPVAPGSVVDHAMRLVAKGASA